MSDRPENQHDEKVDQALDKTGNEYGGHIDKGVDFAQEHTGEGDTNRQP
ncbi:antitoxin [Dactylosporangium sp. NPDC049140]